MKLPPRCHQRDAADGRGAPKICGVHILVVEDEPAIADFLQRGLTAEGYSVTTAADGVDAGRLARSGDVDLMILDLMLPGRDGTDVLAEVREARPQLPVIVLTARTETDSKVEVLDLGATDYVTKPFSFSELAARVRAHLRDRDEASSTRLELGDIRMDLVGRRVERAGSTDSPHDHRIRPARVPHAAPRPGPDTRRAAASGLGLPGRRGFRRRGRLRRDTCGESSPSAQSPRRSRRSGRWGIGSRVDG